MGGFEFAACLLIGDVNDDGDVDALDIQKTALGWPDPATDPVIDLMVNGFVDMEDIIATTSRFGLTCN